MIKRHGPTYLLCLALSVMLLVLVAYSEHHP